MSSRAPGEHPKSRISGKPTGVYPDYPAKLIGWIREAPPVVWWTLLTGVLNLGAGYYAWWGAETNFHEDIVRGLGAGFQCLGILGVIVGIFTTRRLFDEHGAPRPLHLWWAKRPDLLKRANEITANVQVGDVTVSGHAAQLLRSPGDGATLEQKVDYALRRIDDLNLAYQGLHDAITKSQDASREAWSAEAKALEEKIATARQLLTAHATGGMSLSFNGAVFLFVGVLLGTLPYRWF